MSKEEWEEVIAKIMKSPDLKSLDLEFWVDSNSDSYLQKVKFDKEYC